MRRRSWSRQRGSGVAASLNRRLDEFLSLRARGASVHDAIDMAPLTYEEYEQAVADGVVEEEQS